jgi:predicted small secreted protein
MLSNFPFFVQIKEMNMTTKLLLMVFAVTLATSALTGCNTISGAGADVKAAGAGIQEEAQEHKKY